MIERFLWKKIENITPYKFDIYIKFHDRENHHFLFFIFLQPRRRVATCGVWATAWFNSAFSDMSVRENRQTRDPANAVSIPQTRYKY